MEAVVRSFPPGQSRLPQFRGQCRQDWRLEALLTLITTVSAGRLNPPGGAIPVRGPPHPAQEE